MKYIPAASDESMEPMKISKNWDDKPFFPISSYYKQTFGEKVYKITVSVAKTCPHRLKQDDHKGCIFCDEWGAAGHHLMKIGPLKEQIIINREKLSKRYRVNKFLVYFQPYTNTYTDLDKLVKNIELSIQQDQVAGIVIGTRPDCLPEELFPVLKELSQKTFVSIELGVQSFSDQHLLFLNRRHTVSDSVEAIKNLKEKSGVNVGIHLMFGLPDESEDFIIESANKINQLGIDSVKLHNLHVLTNTPLEKMYQDGTFEPVELEPYAEKVITFLKYLSPEIAIQRLAAVAARWDELVAPRWTKERMRPSQFIQSQMIKNNFYQGMCFQKKQNCLR